MDGLTVGDFEYIVYGFVMILIELFGICGNVLSLAVLAHRSMRTQSVNVYLAALAGADALLLCCSFLLFTLPAFYTEFCITLLPTPFIYPIAATLQTATVWIAIALTFERFLVVYNAWSRVNVTVKRARWIVGFVIIFAAIYNFPRWFELKHVAQSKGISNETNFTWEGCRIEPTDFANSQVFILFYYSLLYVIIKGILPIVLLGGLNVYLAKKIYNSLQSKSQIKIIFTKSKEDQIQITNLPRVPSKSSLALSTKGRNIQNVQKSQIRMLTIDEPAKTSLNISGVQQQCSTRESTLNTSACSINVLLIAIVGVFIICQIPCLTYNFAYALSDFQSFRMNKSWLIFSIFRNCTATFQSAINFILYCLIGHQFRRALVTMIPSLRSLCCISQERELVENAEPRYRGLYPLSHERVIRSELNSPNISHNRHLGVGFLDKNSGRKLRGILSAQNSPRYHKKFYLDRGHLHIY